MTSEDLLAGLEKRAPGEWELYCKRSDSRELTASSRSRLLASRREEGWAARWWEQDAPRFACASSGDELSRAIVAAARVPTAASPRLPWPQGRSAGPSPPAAAESPSDLFQELGRLVSAESRGEAVLTELSLRRGWSVERIRNARGLDVSFLRSTLDGTAIAIGRRGSRACEARAVFRWDGEPALEALARRLSDRATLPLSDRASPVTRGEWLLDPAAAASLLANLAPLFCADPPPRWVQRGQLFSTCVTLVDDAAADSPFDGEGTPTRRVVLVDRGAWREELRDLTRAARTGAPSTGHGTRPSYRVAPLLGARRLFFETSQGRTPRELLSSVRRGLFASALTSPLRVNLSEDRFQAEFTGVAVVAGRALSPVAGSRATGRISELLRRISAVGTDRQFFPLPFPVGAPTVLIERANFE